MGDIKMAPREMVCDGMDWIDVAQDRDQWKALVNRKFLSGCRIGGFFRRAQIHEWSSHYIAKHIIDMTRCQIIKFIIL
jgi:hypothetical protein